MEQSADGNSLLLTAQGGVKLAFGDAGALTAGLGFHRYDDAAGNTPFYNGKPKGNSVDAAGNYLFDYALLEVFAEYKTELGDWPLAIFGEWVRNTEASAEDTAYAIGARLGSAKEVGSMQFAYSWQDTEADAVIGTFNDSNFAGGNTNASGHLLKAAYALRDNLTLAATVIAAERGGFAGNARDYDRVVLDIGFSFP
jgi:hypothetical protein